MMDGHLPDDVSEDDINAIYKALPQELCSVFWRIEQGMRGINAANEDIHAAWEQDKARLNAEAAIDQRSISNIAAKYNRLRETAAKVVGVYTSSANYPAMAELRKVLEESGPDLDNAASRLENLRNSLDPKLISAMVDVCNRLVRRNGCWDVEYATADGDKSVSNAPLRDRLRKVLEGK